MTNGSPLARMCATCGLTAEIITRRLGAHTPDQCNRHATVARKARQPSGTRAPRTSRSTAYFIVAAASVGGSPTTLAGVEGDSPVSDTISSSADTTVES